MGFDYKKLQNGSDIRGVAMDGVVGESVNLGKEETFRLTRGFAFWLSEKLEKPVESLKISVGHDSRLTAEELKTTIADTLVHIGVKVYDCGLASTPAMFMSTIFPEYACDGAIMITASHLPFNRNGFKYFDKDGGLNKADISAIIAFAERDEITERLSSVSNPGANPTEKRDLIERYSQHLREKRRRTLKIRMHRSRVLKSWSMRATVPADFMRKKSLRRWVRMFRRASSLNRMDIFLIISRILRTRKLWLRFQSAWSKAARTSV